MITSATSAGFTSAEARDRLRGRATAAEIDGRHVLERTPPKAPIGVRQALTMTASRSVGHGCASSVLRLLSSGVAPLVRSGGVEHTSVSSSPVGRSPPKPPEHRDQRIERRPDLVGVGRGDVAPDVGGARREPRRVGEAAAAESASPSSPDRVADHLHQRARRELREVAEKRQQTVVGIDADDSRFGAERLHERRQLRDSLAVAVARRRQQPRAASKQIRPRVLEASPSPRQPADARRRT